jgi:hypothetical protein
MDELDPPKRATITAFSEADRVGRLVLDDGAEVRFGASACEGFAPAVGAAVFVTALGPHPLGGLRALKIRLTPVTEAQARAHAQAQAALTAARAQRAQDERRIAAHSTTTEEAIVARIKASLLPEEDYEADLQQLYELVDDLTLVGPSIVHAKAILRAIAESPPLAHFGSPGPLVHYLERSYRNELAPILFEAARTTPTYHFFWMVGRWANIRDEHYEEALAIVRGYAGDPSAPEPLRSNAAAFLEEHSEPG